MLGLISDMAETTQSEAVRCSTGLAEFDDSLGGGIPRGALVLVAGNAGSGKTTFCCHFLNQGIKMGEVGIYVSLAESEVQFRENFSRMGFDFAKTNNSLSIMELPIGTQLATEKYLQSLLNRIEEEKAKRLVIDSFSALSQSLNSPIAIRQVLHTVFEKIVKRMGVTTLMVSEIPFGTNRLGVGIEEFVADGIIVLEARFDSTRGRYNRSLRIEKMRGTEIKETEFAYSLKPNGIALFRKEIMDYPNKTSIERISVGCTGLDKMLGGGYFKGTMNLISGATGSGKTIFSMQFVNRGVELGENSLYVTLEDVPLDLKREAEAVGLKAIPKGEKNGTLRIAAFNLELFCFEEHVQELMKLVRSFRPQRLVIDSLSALRSSLGESQLNFLVKTLRAISKELNITTVCTNMVSFIGSTEATEATHSSYFDSIILFRHVELESEMKRSALVLKMRSSSHDKEIRQFEILAGRGIKIEQKFEGVESILLGSAKRTQTLKEFGAKERRITKQVASEKTERKRVFDLGRPSSSSFKTAP